MVRSTAALLAAVALCTTTTTTARAEEQCMGLAPMDSVSNFLGMQLDYGTADHICCNNHRYAERFGYFAERPDRDLFSRLEASGPPTVFYDSVCGLPLFLAPKGRSFADWKSESDKHGWPSFRPEEMVSENVIIHDGGRMESVCGTHLGHNLPSGGKDRYCIDLVCVAGAAVAAADPETGESVHPEGSLQSLPDNYTSSALDDSGKHPVTALTIVLYCVLGAVGVGVLGSALSWANVRRKSSRMEQEEERGGRVVALGQSVNLA